MLVGHAAPGTHLFDHQVPELSLCFQIDLEHLFSSFNTDF